jgi:hypothetical protein
MAEIPKEAQVFVKVETVTAVLLTLWGETRGQTLHKMSKAILEDRANDKGNKQEIWQGVQIRAAMEGIEPNEWISKTIARTMGIGGEINWEVLFK